MWFCAAISNTHPTSSAARQSSEDNPQADAFIDSLIALVEQAPPLSLEAIERSIAVSDTMVRSRLRFFFHLSPSLFGFQFDIRSKTSDRASVGDDTGMFSSSRPRVDSFAVFLKDFHMFNSDELQSTQVPASGPQFLERESPMLRLERAFRRPSCAPAAFDSKNAFDPLDATRLQFCEALLDRYGNAINVLHFLMRRGRMSDAVAYWREKALSSDQFVSGLVEPARKAGTCNALASAISNMAKPTLDHAGPDGRVLRAPEEYDNNLLQAVLAGCRHLKEKRAFSPLCTLQLAIGDDLRGGISKLDLFSREGRQSASKETRQTWLEEAILAIERGLPLLQRLRQNLDPDVFGCAFSVAARVRDRSRSCLHRYNSGEKDVDYKLCTDVARLQLKVLDLLPENENTLFSGSNDERMSVLQVHASVF